MGMRILSVNLTDVNVPEPVQDAQRDAIKADKDRQRYSRTPRLYRNDVCRARAARPRSSCSMRRPTGCRCSRWRRATPRASTRCSEQYEHAPAVTRERMYLETMENVYKNSRKVIVDTKGATT
jgi:modulator of FtsH protease HflK